ncbi:MAG: hypothetical protein KGY80_14345, partial [Candidatus Thorarchaeota archaeon]|nr:hypothetical protein [Candidatus Thorarchaeota archaeon]
DGTNYYAYDRNINYADGEYSGYKMIIPSNAAGKITTTVGPRYVDCYALDNEITTSELDEMWIDDDNYAYAAHVGSGAYNIEFDFQVNMTEGSLYDSFDSAQFKMIYRMEDSDEVRLDILDSSDNYATTNLDGPIPDTGGDIRTITRTIPMKEWIENDLIDNNGNLTIRLNWDCNGGTQDKLWIYYFVLEFTGIVSGHNSVIGISDMTNNHVITVDTDLDDSGLGYWEGTPYCIVDEIYTHISTLTSDGTQIVSLSTSVESTSQYSSRKFNEMTRLGILEELAKADKAEFWIGLGGTTLNWKSTFNGTTTNLTDSDVLAWTTAERDFEPIRNEYHLYGQRIGDNQLFLDTSDLATDPGASSKTLYETRSDVLRGTGATSYPELEDMGKSIVNRNDDVQFHLKAVVSGYSHEIGTELNVTSSILGLTDEKYVVTDFQYDSQNDRTTITLHPRVSVGYQNWKPMGDTVSNVQKQSEQNRVDTYVPEVL